MRSCRTVANRKSDRTCVLTVSSEAQTWRKPSDDRRARCGIYKPRDVERKPPARAETHKKIEHSPQVFRKVTVPTASRLDVYYSNTVREQMSVIGRPLPGPVAIHYDDDRQSLRIISEPHFKPRSTHSWQPFTWDALAIGSFEDPTKVARLRKLQYSDSGIPSFPATRPKIVPQPQGCPPHNCSFLLMTLTSTGNHILSLSFLLTQ